MAKELIGIIGGTGLGDAMAEHLADVEFRDSISFLLQASGLLEDGAANVVADVVEFAGFGDRLHQGRPPASVERVIFLIASFERRQPLRPPAPGIQFVLSRHHSGVRRSTARRFSRETFRSALWPYGFL